MPPAPEPRPAGLDRAAVRAEIEQARLDFRQLIHDATPADRRKPSAGTRWTNRQLLFHMLFGYMIVRTLVWLVRGFSMLPPNCSRGYAQALNTGTRVFHVVNYLGSLGGARVLGRRGMKRVMDNVTGSLIRTLDGASEKQLARGMHFPVGWDPYFRNYMTVQDVLHYATQHYQHHRQQLTVSNARKD